MSIAHKEHIKVTYWIESNFICETCLAPAGGRTIPWDQIHQDWEALRDKLRKLHEYVDLIEPELVGLRKLKEQIDQDRVAPLIEGGERSAGTGGGHGWARGGNGVESGPGATIGGGIDYLNGEHNAYRRAFPHGETGD